MSDLDQKAKRDTYESLMSATLDFVYLLDREGRFLFVNRPLLELWNLPFEEALGKSFHELPYPADMAARLQKQIEQVVETALPVRDETSYTSPHGVTGHYEYIFTPVLLEDGSVEAVAGTTRDITARKDQELELREARTRLDIAMRAGAMATWVLDIAENRVLGDTNLSRLFGVPEAAMRSGSLDQYVSAIHPDDRARVVGAIREAVMTAESYEAEYRVRSDGRERWVVARGIVERGPEGEPLRLPGVVLDITSQKQVEAALRASEERYRSLFASIDQGFCVVEMLFDEHERPVDYRFLETNPAFEGQTGLVAAVGKTARELVPGLEQHWFEIYGRVARSGESISFEDGSMEMQRWFTVEAFRVGNQSSRKVAILCKDITASKLSELSLRQSETRLRDSEARVRSIFAQATAGIAQTDLEGNYLEVNDHYCQILGRPREELLRLNMLDVTDPAFAVENRQRFQSVVHTGMPMQFEKPYLHPDGTRTWTNIGVSLVRDGEGRPLSAVAVAVDITARKRAEDTLRDVATERERLLDAERAAREEAERTSRIKDEFLATLSHELRTPLNAILGWSQIMRKRAEDPQEIARGLAVIERNARAQAQIIEDLLDMSSIIAGKIRLDVQPLDLPALLRSAIDTARPAADAKGITIVAELDPLTDLVVTGDGNRLHQVLWNLLSNAVKFTPRSGRIEVRLARVGTQLELEFTDSGEGIARDFLGFVFDRFRQADASTTRRHGGLGLGLAICKQLVELHGGTISVRSAGTGRGSTFRVTLPQLATTAAPEQASDPESTRQSLPPGVMGLAYQTPELRALRVLVVDDEPDARALVQRVLEDNDAHVVSVGSVAAALAQLAAQRFDLIISDIGMPEQDGYAFIQQVRALPAERGGATPAIALTAYARAEDRVRALRAGFQMHLVKPIEPSELAAVAVSLTERSARVT